MNEFTAELEMLRRVLEYSLDIETHINHLGTHLYNINGIITTLVVAPHEGSEGKWLLRLSPASSFDRWANSMCIEEYFSSANDMREYLYRCQIAIYAQLFNRLSEDYTELVEECERVREFRKKVEE